jgi:Tfp pilus assembly protein PilF
MAVVRALYSLALLFDNQNAALLNNFASLLAQLGEFEAAEAMYRKAMITRDAAEHMVLIQQKTE